MKLMQDARESERDYRNWLLARHLEMMKRLRLSEEESWEIECIEWELERMQLVAAGQDGSRDDSDERFQIRGYH
jgi:hypothetical protein